MRRKVPKLVKSASSALSACLSLYLYLSPLSSFSSSSCCPSMALQLWPHLNVVHNWMNDFEPHSMDMPHSLSSSSPYSTALPLAYFQAKFYKSKEVLGQNGIRKLVLKANEVASEAFPKYFAIVFTAFCRFRSLCNSICLKSIMPQLFLMGYNIHNSTEFAYFQAK